MAEKTLKESRGMREQESSLYEITSLSAVRSHFTMPWSLYTADLSVQVNSTMRDLTREVALIGYLSRLKLSFEPLRMP
jgi:hypothetical protein